MARFPSKEAEVLALSQEMASGRYLLRAKLPRLDVSRTFGPLLGYLKRAV